MRDRNELGRPGIRFRGQTALRLCARHDEGTGLVTTFRQAAEPDRRTPAGRTPETMRQDGRMDRVTAGSREAAVSAMLGGDDDVRGPVHETRLDYDAFFAHRE